MSANKEQKLVKAIDPKDPVYRYMPAEYAVEALQTNALKIGRISELNDPYDCRPHIEDGDSHGALEASILQERHGIISFSRQISDPVIWSHYADRHRGVALEFDISRIGAPCYSMCYTNKRPSVMKELINDPDYRENNVTQTIIAKFSNKAKSWEYEDEVRIFPFLGGKAMVGRNYFWGIPKGALQAVILGEDCSLNWFDIQNAVKTQPSICNSIPVFRCAKNSESFVMDVTSV